METAVRSAFLDQAKHCAALGSPFMGRFMTLCADRLQYGTPVADLILSWQGDPRSSADSVPLRFAGALHALVIAGRDSALSAVYPPHSVNDDILWNAVSRAMDVHSDQLAQWMTNAPQTNEVRRAAAIIPALHMIAARFNMPVDLLELGTSGGLNLRCDQFLLVANDIQYGIKGSDVAIRPTWNGPAPVPSNLIVKNRSGVDLNPLDPLDPNDRLRLRAYLWPDQPDRRARTDAAMTLAATHPALVTMGDAITWLDSALVPVPDRVRIVFHTVAWQYFPTTAQDRGTSLLQRAGQQASASTPLVHLSMEADGGEGAALTLQHWPDGDRHTLARVDFHGRRVRWIGATSL